MIPRLITLLLCLAVTSCNSGKDYESLAASIDSVSAPVTSLVNGLEKADTAAVVRSLSLYRAYRDFMVTGAVDTLSAENGKALARYETSCRQLEFFLQNRRLLLERGRRIRDQLKALRHDAATRAVEPQELHRSLYNEKIAAAELNLAGQNELKAAGEAAGIIDSSVTLIRQIIGNRN